jgi:proline iminopeptidase
MKTMGANAGACNFLYPSLRAYRTGFLAVSNAHRIHYEESGNPKGKPAVFLHGGPGGATDPRMRRFFDPRKYRLVLFDQRGCGRSRPYASLIDNTTWDLVADIESLRVHLGIERWMVFGGSWGSTLGLAYAQTHPRRVTELVLRGVFLLRRSEINWFYQSADGAASVYPEFWEQYIAPIPRAERHDMVQAYYRRLTGTNKATMLRAARAWSMWEGATSCLRVNLAYLAQFRRGVYATALARIESHYFVNRGFFRCDSQLLDDIGRLRRIPAVIVQGRYDMVCPTRSAWDLHKAWPQAELRIVNDAGHSSLEPGTARELVRATDHFAKGWGRRKHWPLREQSR